MKILIDALSARGGGADTYIRQIVRALVTARCGHEFKILLSPHYQNNLIRAIPDGMHVVVLDLRASPLWRRWWFAQTKIPQMLREGKRFDLLFTVTEIGCLRAPVPHVVMGRNPNIYAPLSVYPRWGQRLRLVRYRAVRWPMAYLTLRSADRVVFVSEAFRNQVLVQLRLPREKTRVVYHGLNPIFSGRGATEVSSPWPNVVRKPYLLAVSVIYPHKNYETLLDAFALVVNKKSELDLQLVIAGGASDRGVFLSLQKQAEGLRISDRVHFLGSVEYERLPGLYRNALMFVFPSRLESFGHPLVEAMASGVPIVASDIPVCREICQDAALYFSADDASELAERIVTLIENQDLRRQLRERGLKRAQDFSWERTAAQMVEIFEEVVASRTR